MTCQHPGEFIDAVLTETYGEGWVSIDVANRIGVTVSDFNDVVFHRVPIRPSVAVKFARFFGIVPEFLMLLQQRHEEAL